MAPARLEQKKDAEPVMLSFRCSKFFIILTISLSIYTVGLPKTSSQSSILTLISTQDIFLYAVIVPVIPFALRERVHVPDDEGESRRPLRSEDAADSSQSSTGSQSSLQFTEQHSSLLRHYVAGFRIVSPCAGSRISSAFLL